MNNYLMQEKADLVDNCFDWSYFLDPDWTAVEEAVIV